MHRDKLRMQWREQDSIIHLEPILPLDLRTIKERGEFLLAKNSSDQEVFIRLDKIINFTLVD